MLLKRSLFCIVILISGAAWAKMDFPPVLDTEEKIQTHLQMIRTLIPEIDLEHRGIDDKYARTVLKEEQELIEELRSDREFVRAANARPARIALVFDKIRKQNVTEMGVTSGWNLFLNEAGFDPQASVRGATKKFTQILESLDGRSSAGLLSGLASFLLPSDRRLMAIADPRERWPKIREKLTALPLESLRERFQASRFGIDRAEWGLEELDEALGEILDLEDQLAVALEECNPTAVRSGQSWLLAESIENWMPGFEWSEGTSRQVGVLRKSLLNRFGDRNAIRIKETVVRRLVLREVPPYLAIFRGCVGSDCSTTTSWAFSYAPYERSFWIENERGKKIGYISGAITQVQGKDTLYIRDIAGPDLRRGDVELIVRGLYLARSKFKAKEMTLMSEEFADQNHIPWQVEDLRSVLGVHAENVKQVYYDAEIRRHYFVREGSSIAYDDVRRHTEVRRVHFPEGDDQIRVTKIPTQISLTDLKNNPRQLGSILVSALSWGEDRRLKQLFDDQVDWPTVLDSLRNSNASTFRVFRRELARTFEEHGLPNFEEVAANEPFLLLRGQLNARDFNSDPESAKDIAETILRWSKSPKEDGWISGLVEEFSTDIDQNRFLAEKLQSLQDKSLPQALEKLLHADLKLPFVKLSESKLNGLIKMPGHPATRLWTLDKLLSLPRPKDSPLLSAGRRRSIDGLFPEAISYLNSTSLQYSRIGIEVLYRHPGLLNILSDGDQSVVLGALDNAKIDEFSKVKLFLVILRDSIGYAGMRSFWFDDFATEILQRRNIPKSLRDEVKIARAQLREAFNCERRLWR